MKKTALVKKTGAVYRVRKMAVYSREEKGMK